METTADGKPKKKKKNHRGYAFVVYEREKDMKGTAASPSLLTETDRSPVKGLRCCD